MLSNYYSVRKLMAGFVGLLTWAALICCGHAQAQAIDADWKESEAPAPPALSSGKLLALDMPPYVSLQFGIDPASLTITADGIVRYVVVARAASGSFTAMYEGIHCATGEVKTYARMGSSGVWVPIKEPQWRGLNDNHPSKHAMAFARQGACDGGAAAANSTADIIRAMKK